MLVFSKTNKIRSRFPKGVVTIGTFDGLHLGHQAVIRKLVERSQRSLTKSIVLTFKPHPQEVLTPQLPPQLLTTISEKEVILKKLGIDVLAILDFDNNLAQMKPEEFVQEFLVNRLRIGEVVIGYNFSFGQGRRGGVACLQELGKRFGFLVDVVPPIEVEGLPVSSTRIRTAIKRGDLILALKLLGRPYSLRGLVVEGEKRGRLLSYPTANLRLESKRKLIPKEGVYAVKVEVDAREWGGMMNIGRRPTFGSEKRAGDSQSFDLSLEVHLFDFKGELYGKEIIVHFLHWLREEVQFGAEEELKRQLTKDEEKVRDLIGDGFQFYPKRITTHLGELIDLKGGEREECR